MQRDTRSISIDVCDYTNTTLCNLYSSAYEMPGQAVNVFVHTERNGYKELRFEIPSMLPNGEKNYRMDFLISDYRIKLQTQKDKNLDVDWFLISESRIKHNAFSKNYEIKAHHISSLLNTKNLDLEFSDDDGNNFGTIGQIATTILEGTGWHLGDVRQFYEESKYGYNNVEKVRTFTASAKTGAFKMMSDLCEMFDAKPVYHGEGTYIENGEEKVGRTVDIIPINPFSKDLEQGAVPKEVLEGEAVIELHYDKNVSNITRTLNTDNIVTRLSAYGSYGDRNGACTLQEATHPVLTFNQTVTPGEYCFIYQDGKNFFTSTATTNKLKWSTLDFTSRSYVYDGTNLFKIYKEPKGQYTTLTTTEKIEKNYVPSIMDFTYYDSIGLLTDSMLRTLAEYQTTIPAKHIAATEASTDLMLAKEQLMTTASIGTGFLKLDIQASTIVDGNLRLTIKKTENYPDGVIFRSDYDESKRSYFSWLTAPSVKLNGDATGGKGSVIYIVRQGNPTKWTKTYIKAFGDGTDNFYTDSLSNTYKMHTKTSYSTKEAFPATGTENIIYVATDTGKMYVWFIQTSKYLEITASDYIYGPNAEEPSTITLWTGQNAWQAGDVVYLFSSDSVAGMFGPAEDKMIANKKAIIESTKVSTETYTMEFISDSDSMPSATSCLNTYGWCYHYNTNTFTLGTLYFCWGAHGDLDWSQVYISTNDDNPETITPSASYNYYYSIKYSNLYYKVGNKWTPLDKNDTNEKKLKNNFAIVVDGCITQEIIVKGMKENYYYNGSAVIQPQTNCAFKNEFNNYWLFTTTQTINRSNGGQLLLKTRDRVIWQDDSNEHIITFVERSFKSLTYPTKNEMYGKIFSDKAYKNHAFVIGETHKVSQNIYAYPNAVYQYNLPSGAFVVCLDSNNKYIAEFNSTPFTTPAYTRNIVVAVPGSTAPTSSHWIRMQNYSNIIISEDKIYTIINHASSGERNGIHYLMDQFIAQAHEAYEVKLPLLTAAQQQIKDANLHLMDVLGDMYREGFWQENSYVEGDEYKLYADALDNLKEVSHPEATYDVTFLDLYGSQPITEDDEATPWPDIEITYAAHLIDTDIDTNKWAYIDSLDKCYDLPWKTTMEINTRLSMIGQQSFTDVLARIAEVANETKANQTLYKRAASLTSSGKMAAARLEGALRADTLYILGGTSNWYTDAKGNIVFEDIDGGSAMMLTGRGLLISEKKDAYGDWVWRTAITGHGIDADAIYTGYLSAVLIEAGSITTDKLSASVGQELEISSNKALALYATIDGERPAGSLLTDHPGENDSWIAIAAKNGNTPAYISIQSGGQVNLWGGSEVNIDSQGSLNLEGATMNLTSTGKLLVSGGTVEIKSDGEFLVNSSNFKIEKDNQNRYVVTITDTGKIAGFTISKSSNIDYMYAGNTTSIDSNSTGVYLGSNGINIGGKFKFSADGTTEYMIVNSTNLFLGDIDSSLGGKLGDMDTDISGASAAAAAAQEEAEKKATTYTCKTSEITSKPYKIGDTWTCTDEITLPNGTKRKYYYQYVCWHVSNPRVSTSADWNRTGTAVTAGAALDIDTTNGTIDMIAANTINITSGATINISASKKLSLTTDGTIEIGNGVKPFTIGATTGSSGHAYMRYGMNNISDTTNAGVYVGTDGIALGKGAFKVTADGTATFKGSVTATNFILNDSSFSLPNTQVTGLTNAGVAYSYQVSTSGTTIPTGTWVTTRPTSIDKGKYLWTKIVTTSLTGTQTTAYNVEYYPKDGEKGDDGDDGIYVSTITPLYNLNTSKPSKPTTSTTIETTDVSKKWTTVSPTYISNYNYYRSEKYVYSDNSIKFADVYLDYGLTEANANATTASTAAASASAVTEPIKHNGLIGFNEDNKDKTVGDITYDASGYPTWGGTSYGLMLGSSSATKPMLIASNNGITIAKSATSSDGAAVVIDSSGIVMVGSTIQLRSTEGANNSVILNSSGITIATGAKIKIESGATFTVTSTNFNVTEAGILTASGATITGTINASALSVYNGSSYVSILDSNHKIKMSALDSTTSSKISALTLADGKIDMSCTNVGSSDSTGVYISPTKLTVKSTGDVDFSAAKSIKLKAGSITMSAISDAPDMDDYYHTATGITIVDKKIEVTADANNYVIIDEDGIVMKGKKLNFIDADGVKRPSWGRDDIVIMSKNATGDEAWRNSVETITQHMNANGAHDWVLIRPYYDASIVYSYAGAYSICHDDSWIRTLILPQEGTQTSFGDDASSNYTYTIVFDITTSSAARTHLYFYLSNTSDFSSQTVSMDTSNITNVDCSAEDAGGPPITSDGYQPPRYAPETITVQKTVQGVNLCRESAVMYFKASNGYTNMGFNISNIKVTCTTNFTTNRVPCVVYYTP